MELAQAVDSQSPTAEQEAATRTLAELLRSWSAGSTTKSVTVAGRGLRDLIRTVDLSAEANFTHRSRKPPYPRSPPKQRHYRHRRQSVRFTDPLLATGIYADARPSWRRNLHRLAEVEALPEARARHLALAATSADAATLRHWTLPQKLRGRGVLRARARELVGLAIGLGGDTPLRRDLVVQIPFPRRKLTGMRARC